MKHPGPWKTKEPWTTKGTASGCKQIVDANGESIAEILYGYEHGDEEVVFSDNTAHLILAAPELLEALRDMDEFAGANKLTEQQRDRWMEIRALIARIEGGQP